MITGDSLLVGTPSRARACSRSGAVHNINTYVAGSLAHWLTGRLVEGSVAGLGVRVC